MNVQDKLFEMSLGELQVVARDRAARADESGDMALADTLELAESMAVARERLPANKAYGEWWAGTGINYGWTWRAVLLAAGDRWRDEGKPVLHQVKDGEPFSMRRYSEGLDPYRTPAKIAENESKGTDEYLTPAWVFDALGLTFDLDVCSPPEGSNVPCERFIAPPRDGLTEPWTGTVWMNPPYSDVTPWVARFLEHGNGIALVPFAKSKWFYRLWDHPDVDLVTCGPKLSAFGGGTISMPVFLAGIGRHRSALTSLGTVR